MIARDAAEASRKLTLPQTEDAYQVALPADFTPPQGVEFKFNPNDPAIPLARKFAKEAGLTQDQFSKLTGVWAQAKIAEEMTVRSAIASELSKLGASGTPRVTAVQQFLNAKLGADLGAALNSNLFTAKQVLAFEKLIDVFTTQGASSPANGRTPAGTPAGKIEGYENMTFEQRRAAQEAARRSAAR